MKNKRKFWCLAVRIVTTGTSICLLGSLVLAQTRLIPPQEPIPLTFFGLHIHGTVVPRPGATSPTPWPNVAFGSWRLLDSGVHWSNLEPSKGRWQFSVLDQYVSLAEQHKVDLLLPLFVTPQWASSRPDEKSARAPGNAATPKNLDDWRDYIRTVATRYKGKIHYYEIWNEPNLKDFFTGTPQELVSLTQEANKILKQIDPTNKIVSPSFTGPNGLSLFDQFLKNGGGNYVDIIGYHCYVSPGPPEEMVPLVTRIREVLERHGLSKLTLWDTETGWRIANHKTEVKPVGTTGFASKVLSDDEASAYVARSYVLLWSAGVSRFYWYDWDGDVMGLTEADGTTPKPPAKAYGEVEKWLEGARITQCVSNTRLPWMCQIDRSGGYRAWIVWSTDGTTEFSVPPHWGVQSVRDLSGGTRPSSPSLKIGLEPLLLETRSH